MGRVLSYNIKKDTGNFTREELEAMYEISKRYNSDEMLEDINKAYGVKLKELWTCENFWLGIGDYYPNFDKFKKEEVILFHDENYANNFHGFTKVQGNEFNSLLVFKALIEISKRIPKATLRISDEGEFLLCPLRIKNGLVLPEISGLIESVQYYSMLMMLSPNYKGNILKKLKNTEFQNRCFKTNVHIENTYGDMSNYIDNELRNLQIIEKALMGVTKEDGELFLYNINNRDSKDWFKPELFVRPVDVEKFLDYEMNASTLMDGFQGQGFGLTDEDGEAASYKMMAHMFSMLDKAGFDRKSIQVLGKK